MGMNIGSGGSSAEPEVLIDINTTPLIDVLLVLLIMLIITIPMQFHAVNMNMPVGTPPTPKAPPVIVKIDVSKAGEVKLDGKVYGPSDLEMKFKSMASEANQPEIHLRPDGQSSYESVSGVMAAAQRQGLTKIGIVGNEKYF
ncbi:biopolymer transporter ExbD [Polynucleobacter sp. 30F-ANTBAC]|jgi:biopolymer transport protein ExbD|uniref:ExbD/TolR family protein n=1 Tax=Polynucleobacter sp. 30F-ANTBAC TaxID=2689095 RepID=UPI001C0CAEAD|nr:biopolymer transporter ExbD [Polynucleobacter sp. 30F-ANTBAC]MBU3600408.1 biopolymer transporter ExbD [Polynucleobacter sp. 30F-ANTBAC]